MSDAHYTVQEPIDDYVVEDCDDHFEVEHASEERTEIREVVVLTIDGSAEDDLTLELVANGPISGHRVVTTDADGEATYADPTSPAHIAGPFMVTTGAASDGDPVTALMQGELTEPGWTWVPRSPLYLGVDGTLTAVPPTAPTFDFAVVVAVAVTPTTIIVQPRQPILLA